jgi:tripartite-type tricarboxylate transporter receptor subunit TctC
MRQPQRRRLLAATLFAPLIGIGQAARAQGANPAQPVKFIVPFPPAGGTDAASRLIAEKISGAGGWTFVIENRPGAGGNIGLDAVAKARPDGYTIGMGQVSNLAINPALYAKMPFDAKKDLLPVALVAEQPVVLVIKAESPWKTLADLIAAAKAANGASTMASPGNGTVGHVAGEMLARRAGVRITHVPYKGAGPALTDLIGGQVWFMLSTPQAALPLIKGSRLRALAVTSARRMPILPDVPTVAESGYPGFEAVDWKALMMPAGTPADMVKKLNAAVEKALGQRDTLARLLEEGSAPMGGGVERAARFIRAEQAKWGAAVRDAGIKVD